MYKKWLSLRWFCLTHFYHQLFCTSPSKFFEIRLRSPVTIFQIKHVYNRFDLYFLSLAFLLKDIFPFCAMVCHRIKFPVAFAFIQSYMNAALFLSLCTMYAVCVLRLRFYTMTNLKFPSNYPVH